MAPPKNQFILGPKGKYSLFLTIKQEDITRVRKHADPGFIFEDKLLSGVEAYGNPSFLSAIIRPDIRKEPLEYFEDYHFTDNELTIETVVDLRKKFQSEIIKDLSFSSEPIAYFAFQESIGKSYVESAQKLIESSVSYAEDSSHLMYGGLADDLFMNQSEAISRLQRLEEKLGEHITKKRDDFPEVSYRSHISPTQALHLLVEERKDLFTQPQNIAYLLSQIGAHGVVECEQMGEEVYQFKKNSAL
jgi:hypothetical protein